MVIDEEALDAAARPAEQLLAAVTIGTLVGFSVDETKAIVTYEGQPDAAGLFARSTVDLPPHAIGRRVTLLFENGDPRRPVIIGCVREGGDENLPESPFQVEFERDGARMVVTAKEQLVLRCGSASITLTNTGKILIQGSYISSRAAGVNRIKGGSIQLN